ncbi:MAG: carbohydrate-binding family 9-like protein [Victivallales bacterium]|nr:carbohydrate-binding family 9-like protein [Victivallales bacterium]
MEYTVRKIQSPPTNDFDWHAWDVAETAELTFFSKPCDIRPRIQLRLLHDADHIYGFYRVEDCYTLARHSGYASEVWKDSCVEFFFHPAGAGGYFNLEMNAGGSHLMQFVRNPRRRPDGFQDFTRIPPEHGTKVSVHTTLPQTFEELPGPTTWMLQFTLPIETLQPYCKVPTPLDGQRWTANFYHCADDSSHPRWMTWAPLTPTNFHAPQFFQPLLF